MSAAVRLSKPATAGKPDRKQGTDYELSGQDTRRQGQHPRTGCLQMQTLRRGGLRQQRLHEPELLGRQMPQMRKEHQPGKRIMSTELRVAMSDDFFRPAEVMSSAICQIIMDEMRTPGEGTRPTRRPTCGGCRPGARTRRGDRAIMRLGIRPAEWLAPVKTSPGRADGAVTTR